MNEVKQLKLHKFHQENSAKFTNFAGWEMPVSYGSSVSEHMAVRQNVGFFDVSHMGEFTVKGTDAVSFLNYSLTGDIAKIYDGQAMYSLICNQKGGILDDLIVYRISSDEFFLCVNASNIESDYNHLNEICSSFNCTLKDDSDLYGLIAIQGPQSASLLDEVIKEDFAAIERMHFDKFSFLNEDCYVARTGYTGEDGFEVFLPVNALEGFASTISSLCREGRASWVGLSARDSLRLEAGFCLHGHEISESISPLEAGLMWAVSLQKGDFLGREAIVVQKEKKTYGRVMKYLVEDRRIPREKNKIIFENSLAGRVLSGGYSPILNSPIGTAYIENEYLSKKESPHWFADVRGKKLPIRFTKPALQLSKEN